MIPLLILAVAPGIFVLWYFYHRDRYEPEPLIMVIRVFLYGAFSTIPALILELPFPEGFLLTVVAAPVIEECVKFSAVFLTVFKDREFDEPVDGIVYGVASALGFATVENIFYVLESGVETGILRAVLSVPGHALFAAFWGYSLGVAKFRPRSEWPVLIGGGLAGGILMHAAFNGLLFFGNLAGLFIVGLFVIPFGWWLANRNIIRAENHPAAAKQTLSRPDSEQDFPTQKPAEMVCPGCKSVNRPGAGFCCRCGHDLRCTRDQVPGVPGPGRDMDHICRHCGNTVPDGARYCTRCGAEFSRGTGHRENAMISCHSCGKLSAPGARFCTGCGCPLGNE